MMFVTYFISSYVICVDISKPTAKESNQYKTIKLKEAHIIPIHKGGHQGLAANYRPVALTSHLIKIFEKVICNYIVQFMEENDKFNPANMGFAKCFSSVSQLLSNKL